MVPLIAACICKTLYLTAINSLTSFSMVKVKPTFIGKRNQIPISTSEAQVTAAPIPPCRSMTSGQNLTEVRSVCTNRLNVLSQPISDCLWLNNILSSGCCCSQTTCYVDAARRYSDHLQQWSHVAYHFEDGRQRFL